MLFITGKIFSWIFLPPGLFLFLLLIAFFALLKNKKKICTLFLIINILLLYFFSIAPMKNLLLRPLEYSYEFPDLEKLNFDAIIILGGGSIGKTPDRQYKNSLSAQSFLRTYMGYQIWKKAKKPIIACGGQIFGAVEPEAETIAKYLTELGVPENFITKESKSRDTIENGRFTREILKQKNLEKAALVTSAYHMKRSAYIFKKLNINIIPIPADYNSIEKNFNIYFFMPEISNIRYSYLALHEYIGLLYAKIKMR